MLAYTYDKAGRVEGIEDMSGGQTQYTYDKIGRVIQVTDKGTPFMVSIQKR